MAKYHIDVLQLLLFYWIIMSIWNILGFLGWKNCLQIMQLMNLVNCLIARCDYFCGSKNIVNKNILSMEDLFYFLITLLPYKWWIWTSLHCYHTNGKYEQHDQSNQWARVEEATLRLWGYHNEAATLHREAATVRLLESGGHIEVTTLRQPQRIFHNGASTGFGSSLLQ